MNKEQVKALRQDVQDQINKIILLTDNLPEEDGEGDVSYLTDVRAVLQATLAEESDDEYMESYYDSTCTDY